MAIAASKGMTLVELLVVLAIMGILGTALFQVFQAHNRQALMQEETALMHQELLSAMVIMADAIRMCGYAPNPTSSVTFGLNTTNATGISCTRDMNGNGILDSTDQENIGFRFNATLNMIQYLSNGTIQWQPLAVNIGDLQFAYFDDNNNPTNTTDAIRIVSINATAIPSNRGLAMGVRNRTMFTTVQIRNYR
jgi:prepilin-type N-terminal cleavage/methylation domain-containing protein